MRLFLLFELVTETDDIRFEPNQALHFAVIQLAKRLAIPQLV